MSPVATQVSEQWLLDRYRRHNDLAAREELMRRMAPLVRRVATAYNARGHEDDLHQVAWLGLTKAVDRFDPSFGVPLRTYAIPTMYGEVRRYLRDHSWAMRVPRPLQERVLNVTKTVDRLSARDGRSPTPQAIADELDMELEEVLVRRLFLLACRRSVCRPPRRSQRSDCGAKADHLHGCGLQRRAHGLTTTSRSVD